MTGKEIGLSFTVSAGLGVPRGRRGPWLMVAASSAHSRPLPIQQSAQVRRLRRRRGRLVPKQDLLRKQSNRGFACDPHAADKPGLRKGTRVLKHLMIQNHLRAMG